MSEASNSWRQHGHSNDGLSLHELIFGQADDRLNQVRQALDQGADPNALDQRGWSATLTGALFETPMLVALLDAGGDPNFIALDCLGRKLTPLTLALKNNRVDSVRLLIKRGARLDVYTQESGDITGAMIAAFADEVDLLNQRLDAGDDPNAVSERDRFMALPIAARNNSAQCVNALLARGADPLLQFGKLDNAIISAIRARQSPALKALLESSKTPMTASPSGHGALQIAAALGEASIIKILIEAGADLSAADSFNRTAAMEAIEIHSADALRALLAHGLDPLAIQPNGLSLIQYAAAEHNRPAIEALIEAGASPLTSPEERSLQSLADEERRRLIPALDHFSQWLRLAHESYLQAQEIKSVIPAPQASSLPKTRL